MDFFCDTMRMAVSGMEPFDLDQVLDLDLEVHHQQVGILISALSTAAESLPGLGIVAAVLGVVITMGALGGPPEEIGHKVAAALVGTFLGILLCYGLVGPLASNMAKAADEEHAFLHVLRVLIFSFLEGTATIMTVMMALFIVLWLLNTSKPVREAIAGYFRDPSGTANKMGSKNVGAGENFTITKDNVSDLMEKLQKTIQQMPDFDKLQHQIEMTITSEGLRIEMMETETGTFFDVGSPRPNGNGKELLVLLAQEL